MVFHEKGEDADLWPDSLLLRFEALDQDRFGADDIIGKLDVPLSSLPVQQSFSPVPLAVIT